MAICMASWEERRATNRSLSGFSGLKPAALMSLAGRKDVAGAADLVIGVAGAANEHLLGEGPGPVQLGGNADAVQNDGGLGAVGEVADGEPVGGDVDGFTDTGVPEGRVAVVEEQGVQGGRHVRMLPTGDGAGQLGVPSCQTVGDDGALPEDAARGEGADDGGGVRDDEDLDGVEVGNLAPRGVGLPVVGAGIHNELHVRLGGGEAEWPGAVTLRVEVGGPHVGGDDVERPGELEELG